MLAHFHHRRHQKLTWLIILLQENEDQVGIKGLGNAVNDGLSHLVQREAAADQMADLVEKGYLREMEVAGEFKYKVIFARKRGRRVPLDLWQSLGDRVE